MRRVGRWMMRGATILSLVMCVGTVALWVRSYWRTDVVHVRNLVLSSGKGHIDCDCFLMGEREYRYHVDDFDTRREFEDMAYYCPERRWERAGFGYFNHGDAPEYRYEHVVGILSPHWALAALTGILP